MQAFFDGMKPVIPNRVTLIEYIRRLEEAQHVFVADPARVNAALKDVDGQWEDKLWQRAQAIDQDQSLQKRIAQWQSQAKWLVYALTAAWMVLGVLSAMGLMQASALNFFYVLISVLGMNALMLLLWLWQNTRAATGMGVFGWFASIGRKRPEQRVLADYYQEQLMRPEMKWLWGKLSHQLWLASLGGLFIGVVMMLLVRQYTFNWQSTLLDSGSLGSMVIALAWLPNFLGLNVPDLHAVASSESLGNVAFSKQWANLLWSSLLLYGVLPRVLAWIFCHFRSQNIAFDLPLQLPYYQRLKRLWNTKVIDSAADYRADEVKKRPESVAPVVAATVLIAAWETEPNIATWQQRPENTVALGVIDSREEQAVLLQRLQMQPSQLYLWVRIHSMPDRGVMRRLNQYADHAQAGLTVCLWQEHEDAERLALWQQALNQEAILWQQEGQP